MSPLKCPTVQLPLLLSGQMERDQMDDIVDHLGKCQACQLELESLSASDDWWERAKRGLEGVANDCDCRVLETDSGGSLLDTVIPTVSESSPHDLSTDISAILEVPSHPELLGRIDEYEVEELVGRGGMGVVFRAFDTSLNRPVAIKVMAQHLNASPAARERFEREARAAAAVVHPNVVAIHRVGIAKQGLPYIAMSLADGENLQDHVTRHGPFHVKDVVRIAIQVASGLAAAHKQGLIHRDVKPANVILEKAVSRVVITDFGLARAVNDAILTQSGCLAGTPSYMSPEQVVGGELTHRSDLFSLGSLMYFIATGEEPFRAEFAYAVINKITFETPVPANNLNPDVPPVLSRIIDRLLEKRPADRIASATQLEELLTQVLAHLHEPAAHRIPVVGATSHERRRRRKRISIGVLIGTLVTTVCLAWAGVVGIGLWDLASDLFHQKHHEYEHAIHYKPHVHGENVP